MTLFKCQMYLARTALIGDTFQIELEFRNVGFCRAKVGSSLNWPGTEQSYGWF